MPLVHECRLDDADAFYEELINAQRDLSDDDALMFQAKLLLLLANHIGDRAVLTEAMAAARRGLAPR